MEVLVRALTPKGGPGHRATARRGTSNRPAEKNGGRFRQPRPFPGEPPSE